LILTTARVAPEKAVFRPALPMCLPAGHFGHAMATKLTYAEQLKHPNWQRKRLEMLDGAGWECENCGSKDTTLHVHHKQYFKGRMAWEYEGAELEVLCEDCHEGEHKDGEVLKQILAATNTGENLGLLAGFRKAADWVEPGLIEAGRQTDALAFAAGFVAYLTHNLEIEEMLKVAAFAASLHRETAETRLHFEHRSPFIFGESE
jgi:hypothetical protein